MKTTCRTPSPPPASPITPNPARQLLRRPMSSNGSFEKFGDIWPRTPVRSEQTNSDLTVGSPSSFNSCPDLVDPFYDGAVALPQTPAAKETRTMWHGLLSPVTPSTSLPEVASAETNSNQSYQTDDANSPALDDGLLTQFNRHHTLDDSEAAEILQSFSRDVELDEEPPQPESPDPSIETSVRNRIHTRRIGRDTSPEPAILRRSARFVKKKADEVSPDPVSTPKKKQPKTATPALTWTNPSPSPYDVSLDHTDVPVPHSTDWQLQYPPGGSTHPSYPWPKPDPRLTFHAHFVPLIDNLPDVSQVPKIALPMGWRQVSWCGLLPIVFDPYHQAFKLTPVGPMPLTSEELQQGGLHRYAPGGDLHPETALLPEILTLSDGSNAEIYNFEGVDWTLPWCEFQGPLNIEDTNSGEQSGDNPTSFQKTNTSSSSVLALPPYTEMCDCPDDVVDLEDAWRWMSEKEQNPKSVFKKSPEKSWRGSGIKMTLRKGKAPIPSLIALALATQEDDDPSFLGKQNGREFCPLKSVATPPTVDITLLKDTEFTLMELLCYFPLHYTWEKAGDRLAHADLKAPDVTSLVNMTRNLPSAARLNHSTVRNAVFYKKQDDGTRALNFRIAPASQTYTAESWSYDTSETTDYPLLGLAHGLRALPSGADAGPLTALITHCRAQGLYTTMLSEAPQLLEEAGISSHIDMGNGDPDKEVMARHSEAVAEYKKRIKADKQVEGSEERVVKRKRAA